MCVLPVEMCVCSVGLRFCFLFLTLLPHWIPNLKGGLSHRYVGLVPRVLQVPKLSLID